MWRKPRTCLNTLLDFVVFCLGCIEAAAPRLVLHPTDVNVAEHMRKKFEVAAQLPEAYWSSSIHCLNCPLFQFFPSDLPRRSLNTPELELLTVTAAIIIFNFEIVPTGSMMFATIKVVSTEVTSVDYVQCFVLVWCKMCIFMYVYVMLSKCILLQLVGSWSSAGHFKSSWLSEHVWAAPAWLLCHWTDTVHLKAL